MAERDARWGISPPHPGDFPSPEIAREYTTIYSRALSRSMNRRKQDMYGDADWWKHKTQEWTEDENRWFGMPGEKMHGQIPGLSSHGPGRY